MATYNWSSETCTAEGGNIFLKISHASEIVSRDGSEVVFNWGLRFRSLPYAKDGPATWTYNSIAMRVNITNEGVQNFYALYSPDCSIHNETEEFLYASYQNTSGTPTKYKTERLAIRQTAYADGPEAGYFTISVGTAWDRGVPNADRYTYTFTVPYPAATSYTITYNANGGTGGPSTQTKYQGYSTNLTSSKPTRSGYKFTGWNTRADGSGTPWSSGEYYSGDSGMTLYAQWETTTPIFTPPTLNKTETTISWSNFSINTSSYVYYKLDEASSWTYLGYGTYGFSGSITGLEASSYHTVYFRAENATDRSQATINNVSTTTYSYPYITGLSSSTIEAGSTQTISIYNPLNRTVTLKIYKIEDYDNENTIYEYGTFGSTTTSSTSGSFIVPIDLIATVVKQNWRAWALYALEYNGTTQSTRWGVVTFPASINPVIDTNILWNYFFRYEDCAVENINGADRLVSSFTGSSTRLLRSRSKFCYHLDSDYSPVTTFYGASANTYYVTLNNSSMTYVQPDVYYYQDSEGSSTTNASNASVVPESSYYDVTFMVVDSRGKSATATYSISTYSLQAPTPTITSIARDDGYGTKATLKLSGTWCPNMYGSQVGKSLRFDYRAVGETN